MPARAAASHRTAKKRDVVCPSCSARQPFTYTCKSCGFDIKQYVLALKLQSRRPATAPGEPVSHHDPVPVPADKAPAAHVNISSSELHARAEQEIMGLFVADGPAVQEVPSVETEPDTLDRAGDGPASVGNSKDEAQTISEELESLLQREIAALYGVPDGAAPARKTADRSPEELPSGGPALTNAPAETIDIIDTDGAFSEDIMSQVLSGLDEAAAEAEPETVLRSAVVNQEGDIQPETEPETISETPPEDMPSVEEIIISASLESEPLPHERDEAAGSFTDEASTSAETPAPETEVSIIVEGRRLHPSDDRITGPQPETGPETISETPPEDMPSVEEIIISASLESGTLPDERDDAITPGPEYSEPDTSETTASLPEEEREEGPPLEDVPVMEKAVRLSPLAAEEKTTGVEGKELPLPNESGAIPPPPKATPPTPPMTTKRPDRPKPSAPRRPTQKPRPAPVRVRREPPAPPPPLYPERQQPGPVELLSLAALARSSWGQYKQRAPLLTLFWLITLAGALIPSSLLMGLGYLAAWISPSIGVQLKAVFTIAGLPLALLGMSPGLGALAAAVVDPTANRAVALYRGGRLWPSTAMVLLLTAGMSAGGTVVFIVPGVLAFLGGCMALFVMFVERETPLMAFMKSFEYMKGRTVDSALKLLPVIALFIITASLALAVPIAALPSIAFLGLAVPYLAVYLYRMFENLRGVNGRIIMFQVSRHVRTRWIAAALAGAAMPLILALLLWQLGQAGRVFHLLASLI